MRNFSGLIRNVICGVALIVLTTPAYAQMDPTDPWQRDRAAHQETMDKQAKGYHDRWEEYKEKRYEVDAVGVTDKEGARQEFDEAHAPVDLNADDTDSEGSVDTDTEISGSAE
jgi:hypothetical protein